MRTRISSDCLRRVIAGLCLGALGWTAQAEAVEPVAMDQFIQFQSDELTYDSRGKITRATGNVVAVQAGRRLVADTVTYNELQNVVTAEGNVTLYEPSGEVISAKSLQLTGDLKAGVIEDMRAVLADGARTQRRARRAPRGHDHQCAECHIYTLLPVRRRPYAGAVMAGSRR